MKHKLLLGIIAIIIVIGAVFVVKNYKGDALASLYKAPTKISAGLPPISAPTTCPASGYKFVTKWGTQGSGNGQFHNPQSMAIDSVGNIYVTDQGGHRIEKFDSNGGYITQWGTQGTGNGQFSVLTGIAVDAAGNVYVGDSNGLTVSRIQKFDSNGNYITKWGNLPVGTGPFGPNHFSPSGVAVDTVGNVYVGDNSMMRVLKFNSNGGYITQWGSYGTGSGQFQFVNHIATDSANNVYVVDTANTVARIQKFTSGGTYLTQWGSLGSGNGQFNFPIGITVDQTGKVYVTDADNDRIQKFTSNGSYVTQWGTSGSGNGQFDFPHAIVTDASYVYVLDFRNNRIQKFAPCTPMQMGTVINKISGKVYYDQNKNGSWNTGEYLYSNVSIGLYITGNSTPIQTTTTQAAGDYTFANVPNGTYYVALQSEVGYSLITQPAAASGLVAGHTYVYTVTVNPSTSAQGSTNRDFGTYVFN